MNGIVGRLTARRPPPRTLDTTRTRCGSVSTIAIVEAVSPRVKDGRREERSRDVFGPGAAVWLARLGGLVGVVVVAAAAWGVGDALFNADTVERHSIALVRPAPARVSPAATVAAGADIASLRRVRTIAVSQLREADHMLSTCPPAARVSRSARDIDAWSACARWHVAHLEVNGRINARILYTTAGRLPSGQCQRAAMGRANAMMLLADAAHQLLLGASDRSRPGRTASMHRIDQLRGLIRDSRDDLRRPSEECRRITATDW